MFVTTLTSLNRQILHLGQECLHQRESKSQLPYLRRNYGVNCCNSGPYFDRFVWGRPDQNVRIKIKFRTCRSWPVIFYFLWAPSLLMFCFCLSKHLDPTNSVFYRLLRRFEWKIAILKLVYVSDFVIWVQGFLTSAKIPWIWQKSWAGWSQPPTYGPVILSCFFADFKFEGVNNAQRLLFANARLQVDYHMTFYSSKSKHRKSDT